MNWISAVGGMLFSVFVGATPTPLPSPIPTPVPTIQPSPTSTPTPTRKPTPTTKPFADKKYTPEQIYRWTDKYAGQYGVDANVIRYIARCESTYNPGATNYIYAGLFQFDSRTWKTFRTQMNLSTNPDLRFEAEEAIKTAAFAISKGKIGIWPNCRP